MNLVERAAAALDPVAAMSLGADPRLVLALSSRYTVECFDARGRRKWRALARNRVVTAGLNQILSATFTSGLASPAWYVGLVGASISDAAITASAATLTSASALWTSADAGRAIVVRGAGAAGADLVTTILTYNSAGNVTLAANAGTTVTGAEAAWDARAADTMASHSPWTDQHAYSNANRPAWTGGSVSGGSVDNSGSPASFSINANTTDIFGAFLANNNTVNGSTGTLYGMAIFGAPGSRRANSGDTVNVTVTLTAASA